MNQRDDAEERDPLKPPGKEGARQEINRSGSGGSGGPPDADPREEGSGSESLNDMLGGKRRGPEEGRDGEGS